MLKIFTFLVLLALAVVPSHAQFSSQQEYVVGAGTANAQTASFPNATTIADLLGVSLRVQAGATNTSGATLTVNSFSAQNILKPTGAGLGSLAPGDIRSGQIFSVTWDGTQFELTSTTNTQPTRTILASGSSNYTVPTGAVRIHIRESGGGGGGAGGSNGGNTSFNSVVANGGATGSGTTGGAGGSAGSGSPTNILRVAGGAGQDSTSISLTGSVQPSPAPGGTNPLGSGGPGAGGNGSYQTLSSSASSTGGGGAGEWADFDINAPTGTYAYVVGAAGSAGGAAATAGKAGIIVIDEYYQ